MPKTYSDDERAYIKRRLQEEAAYLLSTVGIRRTTVDMLVERVKIPKGTFYLFYESKELLLFEVMLELHEKIEMDLMNEIKELRGSVTADNLTEVICRFFHLADESGLFRLIGTGEIELLYRKLPKEVMQKHFLHDTDMIAAIADSLSLSPKIKTGLFSAAFRNVFLSRIYKRELGRIGGQESSLNEDDFDEALKLTIRGLVLQMLE